MVTKTTIYDNGFYVRNRYGLKEKDPKLRKVFYGVVPLGYEVRKQLGHRYIYRIRTGNGYFGTNDGERYQDKYDYIVPTSINNPEGQHARDILADAVAAWQALPEDGKIFWRNKERYIKGKTGYSLFIKEYFKNNY